MNVFIGVDPGVTGAVAAVDQSGNFVDCFDVPTFKIGKRSCIDPKAIAEMIEEIPGSISRVCIEETGPRPGEGVCSSFTSGRVFGVLLGVFAAMRAPVVLVRPAKWKKSYGLSGDKEQSRGEAILLFPDASLSRKKDHNRAEALLIADYARRMP